MNIQVINIRDDYVDQTLDLSRFVMFYLTENPSDFNGPEHAQRAVDIFNNMEISERSYFRAQILYN